MNKRLNLLRLSMVAALFVSTSFGCATRTTAADWITTNVDGKFSIDLPEEAKTNSQTIDTPVGEITIKMHVVEFDGGNRAFVVAATDLPAVLPVPQGAEIEQRLDGAQQGAVANVKGKLLKSEKIKLDGYAGRDLLIQPPQGFVMRCRIFLVGRTLIQAQAVNVNSKDVDRYFASLKLIPSEKPDSSEKPASSAK